MDSSNIAIKPWNQQANEPDLWFDRFYSYYRPLGAANRSMEQAYRNFVAAELQRLADAAQRDGLDAPLTRRFAKRPPSNWYEKAQEYHWVARAQAWDIEQRRRQLEADEQARVNMLENHQKIANMMLTGVALRLSQMLGNPKQPTAPDLSANELKEWFALAAKIERESRGLPGEVQGQLINGELQQDIILQGIIGGINLNALDDDAIQQRITELERELGKQPPTANPGNARIIDAEDGAGSTAAAQSNGNHTAGQNGNKPKP